MICRCIRNGINISRYNCCTRNYQPWIQNGFSIQQRRSQLLLGTYKQSSSDVYKHLHLHDHLRIADARDARQIVNHFTPDERELLLQILIKQQSAASATEELQSVEDDTTTTDQLRQLFLINVLPFIAFGFLDNAIMILAGEYIDQSIGTFLCISTMAAAALGNIISDVAGVGLAHYVEALVGSVGFKQPVLTSRQLESRKVRITVNSARAIGLIVGCLIGMFPLLFFEEKLHE